MTRATQRPALAALALCLGLAAAPASAADFSDPTWPCVQRKVANLSWGMMWTGLPIDDSLGDWRADPEIARLAPALAVRRTEMEEVAARIAAFAEGLEPAEAERRLALLFKGVFQLVDRERAEIIAGIARYAGKQQGLADRIDAARIELAELREVAEPSFDQQDRMEALEDAIAWDTRIFDERAQSLIYVCESPVILEKRAFAVAREIMRHLP